MIAGILLSGAIPFLAHSTILSISTALCAFLAGLFVDAPKRVWIYAGATLLEGLFGGISYSAHIVGFMGGGVAIDFLFKRFVKHHIPVADAALIAGGTALWLFMSAIVQTIGFWFGIFQQAISSAFLIRGLLTTVTLSITIFLVLVCISNYSKYGSLVRL